jgi:hypothetical protein
MHDNQLTYRLLARFEFAAPGVDPENIEVKGYRNDEVLAWFEWMQANGLIYAAVARDKLGRSYAGMVVGLTPAGSTLLDKFRNQEHQPGCGIAPIGQVEEPALAYA